jgi:hypothetical protein
LFALAVVAALSGCGSKGAPTALDPTLDTTPPAAPTSLTVSTDPSTNRSTLSWDASSAPDLAGYEVWVAAAGSGTYTLASQGSNSDYTLPEVATATQYDYRVRAYDETGNRSAYSTVAVELRPWSAIGSPGDPSPGRMDP